MRIKIIENFVFISLGLIVVALVYLQVIKGSSYYEQSLHNRIRVIPVEGPRGVIVDRRGTVLADNRLVYEVAVVPQDVQDANALFYFLGKVTSATPGVAQEPAQHPVLRRDPPFTPVVVARDVDRATAILVEENRFLYPGLMVQESYKRIYPRGAADAHVIGLVGPMDALEAQLWQEYGYTPSSLVGKMGVEQTYEGILRGESGGRQIEVNSRGHEVRLLGLKNPLQGKNIQLTIDQRIQTAAFELLDSRPGAVIVMDTGNGDVLGLVSSPSFTPSTPGVAQVLDDATAPLLNRAVAGVYPPGSVFKIPLSLAAVELKKISPDQTFNCPGYYMLGRARFGCSHVHGLQNLNQALAHSCNVYFYHLGRIVTSPVHAQYARALGLGRITGIDLPFEATGHVDPRNTRCCAGPCATPGVEKVWYPGDTLNFSIGQGSTLVTPLQLTVMMAAVANDGLIFRPRLVKAIDGVDLPAVDTSRLPTVRLHETTWRLIQQGLRAVVTDPEGTAHLLNDLKGMTIAGKTGTAQAGANKPNHAWMVGVARSAKNNLAFCVFLEHGGASTNAVALAHELLLRMQQEGII